MLLFRTHYKIGKDTIRVKILPECTPTLIRIKSFTNVAKGYASGTKTAEAIIIKNFNENSSLPSFFYNSIEDNKVNIFSNNRTLFNSFNSDTCELLSHRGILLTKSYYTKPNNYYIAAFIGETQNKEEVLVIDSTLLVKDRNFIAKCYRKYVTESKGKKPVIIITNLSEYVKPKFRANVLLNSGTFDGLLKTAIKGIDFTAIEKFIELSSVPSIGARNYKLFSEISNSVEIALFNIPGVNIPDNILTINATKETDNKTT